MNKGMIKKKKNGFTLIELLVAIALMLSVLGIAVVNFITVSNRKKQEAWGNVKGQIEIAAEQYFKSNEYLFEGVLGNVTGKISVGKLVEEDYLNKVTNPVTGKPVAYCMIVQVTRTENGVFKTDIVDNPETNDASECETDYHISISEVGAPLINIQVSGEQKIANSGWYTNTVNIRSNVKENNNGQII